MLDRNKEAFFALIRAGLWEKECRLLDFGEIDFSAVLQLAEEQSVVGLVAAGLDHVVDVKPPKPEVLQFFGRTMRVEQHNSAMNHFIAAIVEKLKKAGISSYLIKGQGVARCYECPQWRACGDVDFLLDTANYEKAKAFLTPIASGIEPERERDKHLGMTIGNWVVELHGTLYCGLSKRVDRELDDMQNEVCEKGAFRTWKNGETEIRLPSVENDAVYIFTHILNHFYMGGVGLRQICDWSRLLWTYRNEIDRQQIESRLRRMRLMSEWRAFGAMTVDYLGMPDDAMPLYCPRYISKGKRVMKFVMQVGNFGHSRDNSYYEKYPYIVRKVYSSGRRIGDLWRHARIFPLDSLRFLPNIMFNGLRSAVNREG